MDNSIKKRWISLYVENQVGVLSKISGLFSAKSYNMDSLTVGTTEDPTVSRMTIATVSDDETFEQIKKQLNRTIEVIKVIDFTDIFVRMKEILERNPLCKSIQMHSGGQSRSFPDRGNIQGKSNRLWQRQCSCRIRSDRNQKRCRC